MTKRYMIIKGDKTSHGGVVLEGHSGFTIEGVPVACVGHQVSCPRCLGTYPIVEGTSQATVMGLDIALEGMTTACGAVLISSQTQSSVEDNSSSASTMPSAASFSQPERLTAQDDVPTNHYASTAPIDDTTAIDNAHRIRLDAQSLLACAHEVCEKHLYHTDIKQNFICEIEDFSTEIVSAVENGSLSYQEGARKLREEEKSLWEQSFEWISRGLSVLGGAGLMMAGAAMCTTGGGCIIGAYLAAHDVNGIYEGILGNTGFLKAAYQASAKQLGVSEFVGSLAYDLVDLGISVNGKLKLVPKINEFGNPVRKLWHYGREDLVRAYRQMNNKLLWMEIIGDVASLATVIDDAKNIVVFDKETQETNIVISEPESIKNVGEIIDDCNLVIRITGEENPEQPNYHLCTRLNGERYRNYFDGHTEEEGILR